MLVRRTPRFEALSVKGFDECVSLTALIENPRLTLIEIPHPCGSAEKGGPPSKLLVSDASCSIEGGPLSHAHMGG